MPTVVAEMLTVLRAEPGMSVLEIGTGTGWNTALLAHRLGGEHVTSVEIDPHISAHAPTALADAGYGAITVLTGDGTLGHPRRAPYDRVLSTACVYPVPYPWIAQTRAGGLVLTPWGTEYYNGHLLALTVAGDGTATGRIVGKTAFMTIRDQRIPWIPISDIVTDDSEAHAEEKLSKRHPRYYVTGYDARTAIGVQVPRCIPRYTPPDAEDLDGSCGCSTNGHTPGQRYTTSLISPDRTEYVNTGLGDCSMRSAPPIGAGKPPENPRHTPGASPSHHTASEPNSRDPRLVKSCDLSGFGASRSGGVGGIVLRCVIEGGEVGVDVVGVGDAEVGVEG